MTLAVAEDLSCERLLCEFGWSLIPVGSSVGSVDLNAVLRDCVRHNLALMGIMRNPKGNHARELPLSGPISAIMVAFESTDEERIAASHRIAFAALVRSVSN